MSMSTHFVMFLPSKLLSSFSCAIYVYYVVKAPLRVLYDMRGGVEWQIQHEVNVFVTRPYPDIVYALFDIIERCQLCGMFVHSFSYTLRTVARHDASQT